VGINDFDETLPGPWEWDLKRLATSVVAGGRFLGADNINFVTPLAFVPFAPGCAGLLLKLGVCCKSLI
jgi:hypothetical protein